MWEKLSNSSLLFSKNYYKTDSNFYSNTPFIHRLYNYYIHKGYHNLISSQFVNIFITNFLVLFLLFLVNCVDFTGIIQLGETKNISEFIQIDKLFNLNYFEWILLVFFYIFTFMKIISVFDDIYAYKNIKVFYKNTLEINDRELDYISWDNIIKNLNLKTNQNLNIFYINNIINSKNNYFISLLDEKKSVIDVGILNKLMEWNLFFCIFFTIYNNDFKINDNIFTEKDDYSKRIKMKMRCISIINFIFMPFILTFLGFYYLFSYGEIFYNTPRLIVSRGYSNRMKWSLRYYNELPHEFEERIHNSEKILSEYTSLFKFKLIQILARLLVFLLSSVFIVLVFASIINDRILVNLMIFPDKPVLWVIGILAPVIAVFRSLTIQERKRNPDIVLEELSKNIFIDEEKIINAHKNSVYKKVSTGFNYKAYLFIKDFLSIIITPFVLWNISYKSEKILRFILKNTDTHNKLLFICKNSNFENCDIDNRDIDNFQTKKELSYTRFTLNYPYWKNIIDNSVQINVI